MSVFSRVLFITGILLFPLSSFGGDIAKFQHSLSLYLDDKGAGFQRPEGVACNDKSLIVVGDTGNDRLLRFSFQEKTVKAATEIKIPQLSNPICVQLNSRGEIFALDGKHRRIVRLDPEGGFKGYLAPEGMPSSSAMVPRSFKIGRDDTIYILDIFLARVLVLDSQGKYLKQIEFPREYAFFSDLTVNSKGAVLLIDSIQARVFSAANNADTFSPLTGPLKEYLNFPVGITTDKRGTIYLADGHGGAIVILASDGSFLGKQLSPGWNEGRLYYPTQICINEKDEIFIADRGNNRIQIFTVVK